MMPNRLKQFNELRATLCSNFKLSDKHFDFLFSAIVSTSTTQEGIAEAFTKKFELPMSKHKVYLMTKYIKEYFLIANGEDRELKIGNFVGVASLENVIEPI